MNIVIMALGAERREKNQHLQNLVSRLATRPGITLTVACLENSFLADLAAKYNLEVISCKSGGFGWLRSRMKLNWRLRNPSSPQLIQCFDQKSLALATQVAAKKDHLNIIYSALLPEAITDKQILENIHLVGAVVADTKEISDIVASHGFLRSSIFIIPGCIDAGLYAERRPRKDGRVIFACGDPLEEGRGYDQLLQGLAYLYGYEEMPSWELRIASGGPMFDSFLAKAAELHVDSRLAIFGGFHGPDILRDCDIMVCPSGEGMGSSLSVKEGWAAGLAVVCSDVKANQELVQNGKNGLMFQNQNADDLASKMYTLAKDSALRDSMAESGKACIKEYSCDALLHKHMALYQKILGQEAKLDSLDI